MNKFKRHSAQSPNQHQGDRDQNADAAAETSPRESTAEKFYWKSALLLLVGLLGWATLVNADIWWHLRTGELILERGTVPATDWFTYTNPDAKWIDLHWGFQILAAFLYGLGGATALVLLKCAVAILTFAACLSISRQGWPAWQSVAIWLVPLLVYAGRYYVRPEILSLCFFACTLAILHHSTYRPKLLWLLPLLQILWVNVQGLFVLQFVAMGCLLLEQFMGIVFPKLLSPKESSLAEIAARNSAAFKKLLTVTGVTLAASFVNPYGYRGVMFPLELLSKVRGDDRQFFYNFANELAGLSSIFQRAGLAIFADLTLLLMSLMAITITVSFVALFLAGKGVSLYRLLLFVGFAYLTWQMSRNSTLFAIAGGVVLRLNLGELFPLARQNSPLVRIPKAVLAGCMGLLIVSVPTNIYWQLRPTFVPRTFGVGLAQWYPVDACEFIQSRSAQLPDRVYAWHIGLAAHAIYHLAPGKKVFADARLETNTKETLTSYLNVIYYLTTAEYKTDRELMRADSATGEIDRTKLPLLLFSTDTLIDSATVGDSLTPNLIEGNRWQCVYIDPAAAVFVSKEFATTRNLPSANVSYLLELLNQNRFRARQYPY